MARMDGPYQGLQQPRTVELRGFLAGFVSPSVSPRADVWENPTIVWSHGAGMTRNFSPHTNSHVMCLLTWTCLMGDQGKQKINQPATGFPVCKRRRAKVLLEPLSPSNALAFPGQRKNTLPPPNPIRGSRTPIKLCQGPVNTEYETSHHSVIVGTHSWPARRSYGPQTLTHEPLSGDEISRAECEGRWDF